MRIRRVFVGLIAGLVIGSVVAAWGNPSALRLATWLEPIGTLWINAIRMTVVPLVVSLLFVGVASAERGGEVGRLGAFAFGSFGVLLVAAAVIAILLAPPLLRDMKLNAGAALQLRDSATSTAAATGAQLERLPGFAAWVVGLVPANPIRAAADGAMMPLIVFTLLLALASRHIEPALRESLIGFFGAIAGAMTTIVGWIIAAAPVGIFAVVVGAASRFGVGLAGAMGYYIVAMSALLGLFTLLLYPFAVVIGRVRLPAFARALVPSQVVALGSSSSLATLPALIDGGRALRLPSAVSGFVLPLAVSTFKVATPITWTMGTLFLARLYGVSMGPGAVVAIALTSVVLSLSIPGVPQGALLLLAPVITAYGIPAEGIALLIAADTIPDLVATMTNVTGDLTAAAMVARTSGVEDADEPAGGDEHPGRAVTVEDEVTTGV
jgi:Na+/H+-dicarboxylate symporter